MTGASKLLLALLAALLITTGVYFVTQDGGNCWTQYQTEETAIMACEVHE